MSPLTDSVAHTQRPLTDLEQSLLETLREIAAGCRNHRPGHCNAHENLTKAQIEEVALAAIARATGSAS